MRSQAKAGSEEKVCLPGQNSQYEYRAPNAELAATGLSVLSGRGPVSCWARQTESPCHLRGAAETVRGIQGVEVISSNADVDENGNLSLYKVNCKIAFIVER